MQENTLKVQNDQTPIDHAVKLELSILLDNLGTVLSEMVADAAIQTAFDYADVMDVGEVAAIFNHQFEVGLLAYLNALNSLNELNVEAATSHFDVNLEIS